MFLFNLLATLLNIVRAITSRKTHNDPGIFDYYKLKNSIILYFLNFVNHEIPKLWYEDTVRSRSGQSYDL